MSRQLETRGPRGLVALLALAVAAGACGNGAAKVRPYPEPAVQSVLDQLEERRASIESFQAESVMVYWRGDKRIKGTVLLMGKVGSRVRLNALNPTGDNVASDLACDGIGYAFIDYNNNCQLSGPCTRDSIAQLLGVSLEPDDFFTIAVGSTPVIADAAGSTEWDPQTGLETLRLQSTDNQRQQIIKLDGKGGHWDVRHSELLDARGNTVWKLEHKDYETMTGAGGKTYRVPGKTEFLQPPPGTEGPPKPCEDNQSCLQIRWEKRTLNPELDQGKFVMAVPEGLPRCQ